MNIEVNVRGIIKHDERVVPAKHPHEAFHIIAKANVELPETGILIRGANLAWSDLHGVIVVPPFVRPTSGRGFGKPVTWRRESPIGRALAQAVFAAYEAIGGGIPDGKTAGPIRPAYVWREHEADPETGITNRTLEPNDAC